MTHDKPTERELAALVINWLHDFQWEVYQEVSLSTCGGIRADIVAKQGRIVWVIETKCAFGMQVLAQAWNWRPHAHYVSIAVPYRKGTRSTYSFENKIIKDHGIGYIEINSPHRGCTVYEDIKPKLNRNAVLPQILDIHRYYSEAGNSDCDYYSDFKHTKNRIISNVIKNGSMLFSDLLDKTENHYRTPSSFKACMLQHIGSNTIPELVTFKDNNKLYVKLSDSFDKDEFAKNNRFALPRMK